VVERFGYLIKIENSVKSLSATAGKPIFLSRVSLNADEPFEQFVARGRDVLISGVALGSTVGPLRTFFKAKIHQGTNLRFLLLDPESSCLEFAARFHGTSPELMRKDILSSLGYLQELTESLGSRKSYAIQIRLLKTIPSAGITICDGNRDTGEIRCELYLYQTDVVGRPAFRLTPADGLIYHHYRDTIERLWSDSQPWMAKHVPETFKKQGPEMD
jgi:hypothetical protein